MELEGKVAATISSFFGERSSGHETERPERSRGSRLDPAPLDLRKGSSLSETPAGLFGSTPQEENVGRFYSRVFGNQPSWPPRRDAGRRRPAACQDSEEVASGECI